MKFFERFDLEYWHIGIIDTPIEKLIIDKCEPNIKWIKYDYKDRFFADPFLYSQDEKYYYILVEEYLHYEKKGKIVLLTVDKTKLEVIARRMLIDESTHLSFPYFYKNKIFPENFRSGCYYSYEIGDSVTLKNIEAKIPCIDPIIFEYKNREYLFFSKEKYAQSKVFLFFKDGQNYVEHPRSPISEDPRTARMAGKIFKVNNKYYRPVQDCKNKYGEYVRIMEIEQIDEKNYQEKEILKISSRKFPPYNDGIHTFNVENNIILVDGYTKRKSLIYKLMLRIFRTKLLNNLNKEKKHENKIFYKEN